LKKILPFITAGLLFASLIPLRGQAQDFLKNSEVHGSSQADAIYYLPDSKLGITDSSLAGRLIRMNGYTEVNYSLGDFTAGMRFEAYLPPLLGYDAQNEGLGVPYWYARYKTDFIDVTAGNFYEQFGYGMMLRTYQEWTLGFDNSLKGLRVKIMPTKGITLKGVYGVQRYYWDPYKDGNRGIVKGVDGDFYLNDIFTGMADSKLKVSLGGTFVSVFQKDATRDIVINGRSVTRGEREGLWKEVGVIFQRSEDQLFAPTVLDDVMFGPLNLGMAPEEARTAALEALEAVGARELEGKLPNYLSGGQKRLVSIAGILAMKPQIIAMDEPTSDLDPVHSARIEHLIVELKTRYGISVVIATHDLELAARIADRICLVRDGAVFAEGSPREVFYDSDLIHEAGLKQPDTVMTWLEYCRAQGGKRDERPVTRDELVRLLGTGTGR